MASAYPGAVDSFSEKEDGVDQIIYAAHVNELQNSVVAVETELGTDPAGTATDVKTRLAVLLSGSGAFKGPQQVKIVAKAGGEYTSIQSALTAITDATAAKPYAVLIFPGVYDEAVYCKDHVHLVGTDPRSCAIDRSTSHALRVNSAITASISNLYVRTRGEEGYALEITNGTLYAHNCIFEGDADSYVVYISTGLLHARNCIFNALFSTTLNVRTASTFRYCRITSTVGRAALVAAAAPEFSYCELIAGGDNEALFLNDVTSNPKIAYTRLLKSGSATVSVDATDAATNAQIYLCSMNAALHGNVSNLIDTPYNVIDADLT